LNVDELETECLGSEADGPSRLDSCLRSFTSYLLAGVSSYPTGSHMRVAYEEDYHLRSDDERGMWDLRICVCKGYQVLSFFHFSRPTKNAKVLCGPYQHTGWLVVGGRQGSRRYETWIEFGPLGSSMRSGYAETLVWATSNRLPAPRGYPPCRGVPPTTMGTTKDLEKRSAVDSGGSTKDETHKR
jgi:hypothetical protein